MNTGIISLISDILNIIEKIIPFRNNFEGTIFPFISYSENKDAIFIKITPSNTTQQIAIDIKPILEFYESFKFRSIIDWEYHIFRDIIPCKKNEPSVYKNNIVTICISNVQKLENGLYKIRIELSGTKKAISYVFAVPGYKKKLPVLRNLRF